MKTFHKVLLTLLISTASTVSFCQDKDGAKALIDQGTALHDQGKYAEAIDKYREAIKIDTVNYRAYYEMCFSLYTSGKAKEALPYLDKIIRSGSDYKAECYDLLGNIYDDDKQPDKAIEYYKEGINADPGSQRLHFNLGIALLRQKKNKEAEIAISDALKLDPKHASSHRIYALDAYAQNELGASLLAWCNFLILEPQSARSAPAYKYVKTILNYGIKKTGEKSVTLTVSDADLDKSGNMLTQMSILTATDGKKDLSPVDSVQFQITEVFKASPEISGKMEKPFFSGFYAKYFKKLAESEHMPVVARLVTLSAYNDENLKWFKENPEKLKALDAWIAANKREL